MKSLWTIAIALSAVACGGADTATFGEEAAPAPETPGSFDTNGPPSSPSDGCAAAAKLVYVVSQEKDLYSFAPDTMTFTEVGRLACPAAGVPASMAVDRSGTAWVNYADGSLYRVSTQDASCEATGFVPDQQGFLKFGMAFASDRDRPSSETLYVSGLLGTAGKGFGKIDLATMKLAMLGEYSAPLAGKAAELTGTGDGRLYGFFTTSPHATLATIDMTKGATSNGEALSGVSTGNAFAFSFWGGDFWFYTSDGPFPSRVTRLEAASGTLSVAMDDVGGFRIVGAGVSTCAPTTSPR